MTVTVLMSDVRGYSGIAERVDATSLAGMPQYASGRDERAILAELGTVMQYVGDAVMAVFGAPFPQADHADRALAAAIGMHQRQHAVNEQWCTDGLPSSGSASACRPARSRPRCSAPTSTWSTRSSATS